MGYEEKEYVALCDGCGKGMVEGDEFWNIHRSYAHDKVATVNMTRWTHSLEEFHHHYCCVRPCLEKAVLHELRALHAASHQTSHPDPTQAQSKGRE